MEDRESRFKSIVKENHDRIFRICACHTRSHDDCNDLFQQVLINIWQALRNFRGDSKISTWIYRIALNTAIDFSRAEKRRNAATHNYLEEVKMTAAYNTGTWEKIREENRINEMLLQINQLNVIDKLIISLVLEDLSSKEIAEVVGMTEPNVRVKIHRIKEGLKIKTGGLNHD